MKEVLVDIDFDLFLVFTVVGMKMNSLNVVLECMIEI